MTRKVYRTAQGKTVDLGALIIQNENTRAVGNMKVNARGDLVDGWNRPIDRRTQQVQKQYDRQVTNVQDQPVVSAATAPESAPDPKPPKSKTREIPAETQPESATNTDASPATGLAAAIARARQIKQEPIVASRDSTKNSTNKRI